MDAAASMAITASGILGINPVTLSPEETPADLRADEVLATKLNNSL